MCKSHLHPFLAQLPKCEHHIHLEGALSPQVLFTLATRNNISLPTDDPAYASVAALSARYRRFTSLDDFLHYYYIGMSVLIHASDFEDLAMDYFRRAAAQNVMHAEVFFDPQAHTSRGVAYSTVLSGFTAARRRAEAEFDISTELICCFLRHLPVPDCMAAFTSPPVQASFADRSVIAIGLDSSEAAFPPSLFAEIYAKAREIGIHRTAHAGEEGTPSYIASALDDLHAQRIDHGVRAAEDPELLLRLASQGTLLTLCPLSNVCLGAVPAIADLPVRAFLDAGVQFSINSDDPAYFGGYILENYCAVQEAFGLEVGEWEGIAMAGIQGSWCGEERKEVMLRRLREVVAEWKGKVSS